MFEKLLDEAEKAGIEVTCLPLRGKTKGIYYDGYIALNKSLITTAEKTCVLAEELGHHFTSYGNIINQKITANRKQEVKARRWAVERLVPLNNIIKAFEAGCRNLYEIAEYIGVTERFLQHAFSVYNAIYGKYKKFGWYMVYFDPPGVINIE